MSEQLFQIGIKGLARNSAGEILMVLIPEWGQNPAHWDLPGGRMDAGENFLETLKRELTEEIGVSYIGEPKQLMAFLTNISIPVGETRVPLVFIVYEVKLPEDSKIVLNPESAEEEFKWFSPADAATEMAMKFSSQFCELVRSL